MKKRSWLAVFVAVILLPGCTLETGTLTQTPSGEVGTLVAATLEAGPASPAAEPSTPEPTQLSGSQVSYEDVSFVIPGGLAGGASTDTMTAVESNSVAPWEIAPTHLRFTLTEYQLQDKFHQPRIFVFPASEYAGVNSAAAEQIDRLQRILVGGTLLEETLPVVPFFNATPLLAAQIRLIPFQSGSGVRALTQYAQYAAPVNNRELFYHFEGLTSDGSKYVIAILPVTAPVLAEDEKPDASVPEGGVPIPTAVGPNQVYYFSVTEKLNSLAPDEFSPWLDTLDALIQSLLVN
jgi:hypothetical protein